MELPLVPRRIAPSGRGAGRRHGLDDAVVVVRPDLPAGELGAGRDEGEILAEVAVVHADEQGVGLRLREFRSAQEGGEPVEHEGRLRREPVGVRLPVAVAEVAVPEDGGRELERLRALRAVGIALPDLHEVAVGGLEVLLLDGGVRLLEQVPGRIHETPERRAARPREQQGEREAREGLGPHGPAWPGGFGPNAASMAALSFGRASGSKRPWNSRRPSRVTSIRAGSRMPSGRSDVVYGSARWSIRYGIGHA